MVTLALWSAWIIWYGGFYTYLQTMTSPAGRSGRRLRLTTDGAVYRCVDFIAYLKWDNTLTFQILHLDHYLQAEKFLTNRSCRRLRLIRNHIVLCRRVVLVSWKWFEILTDFIILHTICYRQRSSLSVTAGKGCDRSRTARFAFCYFSDLNCIMLLL